MAYVNGRQFDSIRVSYRNEYGNWPLLNRSWLPLLESLGEKWWGSVSEEQLISYLNRPDVTVGAIAIAAYVGDMPGGVCSGMVKSPDNSLIPFAIYITRGYYKCTDFVDWDSGDPAAMIEDVIKAVPEGYLMARPGDIPDGPNNSAGTLAVEGMRYMKQQLKHAWWGLLTGSSPGSYKHIEVIQDLQKMEEEHPNPAAAICHMDDNDIGYLFELVTANGNSYKVTFDKYGFVLVKDVVVNNVIDTALHFDTMARLLDYMSKVEKVTFVPRPSPTLQELCRSKMVKNVAGPIRRQWEMETPPHLKHFMQSGPYAKR